MAFRTFLETLLKPAEKNNSAKGSYLWQGAQLLAVFLLCVQLYSFERSLLGGIESEYDRAVGGLVGDYLNQWLWFFLPNQFFFLVLPLVLLTIGMLAFTKRRWLFFSVVVYLLLLILISNRIYHSFFDSIIPISALGITGQLWKVKGSIIASFQWRDLIWLLTFLWVPLFGYIFHNHVSLKIKENKYMFIFDKLLGVFLLVLSFHAASVAFLIQKKQVIFEGRKPIKVIFNADQSQGDLFVVPYHSSYRCFAVSFGMFNYYLYSLGEFFSQRANRKEITEAELQKVAGFLEDRHRLNKQQAPLKGLAKGRNIVLFSMESFSTWLIGLEIDGREITPTMNKLAADHLYWPNIIDGARAGGTSDAEFSLLTGLLTDLSRVAAMGIAEKNELLGLPKSLRSAGYSTYSFHGNDSAFWNRNIIHPKLGVDTMVFQEKMLQEEVVGLGVPDHVMFEKAYQELAKAAQPFFGFMISLTSHHPYPDLPFDYTDLDLSSLPDGQLKQYLKLANYTDKALANFMSQLSASDSLNNTMLVLYGDHRPPLDESDYKAFEKLTGKPLMQGRILQLPVIMAIPGQESEIAQQKSLTTEIVGGLQDIYPTVLHLIGEPIPYGIYGINLMVENHQRGVFPLLKFPSSYALNGQVFTGRSGELVRDDLGPLFINKDLKDLPTAEQRKVSFQNAFKALEVHLYLFNQNAQQLAIEQKSQREKEP